MEQPEDILDAEAVIRGHLLPLAGMSKDELLMDIKARRKAFLNTIHSVLKPVGFKRKGNEWTYRLSSDHLLQFVADKSSFCDSYRFLILIRSEKKLVRTYTWCNMHEMQPAREEAYDPDSAFRFDWQLKTKEDLMRILEVFLDEYVVPAKAAGMDGLAKMDHIRARCACNKNCCVSCWLNTCE